MNLHKLILIENACYKAGRKIAVKGIMVHSTGANNPTLRRYVGSDGGLLGKNQYNNHWNQYKPDVATAKAGMGQRSGTAMTSAERSSGNVITNLTARNALHQRSLRMKQKNCSSTPPKPSSTKRNSL